MQEVEVLLMCQVGAVTTHKKVSALFSPGPFFAMEHQAKGVLGKNGHQSAGKALGCQLAHGVPFGTYLVPSICTNPPGGESEQEYGFITDL